MCDEFVWAKRRKVYYEVALPKKVRRKGAKEDLLVSRRVCLAPLRPKIRLITARFGPGPTLLSFVAFVVLLVDLAYCGTCSGLRSSFMPCSSR